MTGTYTQPTTPDQIQAQLDDETFLDDLFKSGPDGIRSYFDTYKKAIDDESRPEIKNINEDVKNIVETQVAEFIKSNSMDSGEPQIANTENRLDRKLLNRSKGTAYNKYTLGHGLENKLESDYDAVDFFRAAYHKKAFLPDAAKYAEIENKTLSYMNDYKTALPADGGLLIPETLRSEIMKVALETSIVRSRAKVVTTTAGKTSWPSVEDDDHTTSVFGGIKAYWEDESEQGTKSQGKFKAITIEPKKLRSISVANNDLIEDAPMLLTFIGEAFPQALSWFEDIAFIEGSGVGRPLGFKDSDAAITVAKESGQAADTIVAKNIFKMYARLLPRSNGNAIWLTNKDTFPQLAELNVAVGTGGNTIWLPSAREGAPSTLLGMPIVESEHAETLGDEGDIMLADLSHYLIGDRQSIQISSSEHEEYSFDRTVFKAISRVDGRPTLTKPFKPRKSTATLSAFVKLAARA